MYKASLSASHAAWSHMWVSDHDIGDMLAMEGDAKDLSKWQQMECKCQKP